MPILKNAKKALRVSQRKAVVNRRIKSMMKTMTDAFIAKPSKEALAEAFSAIDRAVKNNIIHRNRAARIKSRLSKMLG